MNSPHQKPQKDVSIQFRTKSGSRVTVTISRDAWRRSAAWSTIAATKIGNRKKNVFVKLISETALQLVHNLWQTEVAIPGIPTILHCGSSPELGCFYVSEAIDGRALSELDAPFLKQVTDRGQVTSLWRTVSQRTTDTIIALADLGLMFPDLSPKNIMIAGTPPTSWLIDIDSSVPFGSTLEPTSFDNRFTLAAATKLLYPSSIQRALHGVGSFIPLLSFRNTPKADLSRTQAALIGFTYFIRSILLAHKRNAPRDVLAEIANSTAAPKNAADTTASLYDLPKREKKWRDTIGRSDEDQWVHCRELLSAIMRDATTEAPGEDVRKAVKDWLRIACRIDGRLSISQRLARWPTLIDSLPPEIDSVDLIEAKERKAILMDLQMRSQTLHDVIQEWDSARSWGIRESLSSRIQAINVSDLLSSLKREEEQLGDLESQYNFIRTWIEGLPELNRQLGQVVRLLRGNRRIESQHIIEHICSSRFAEHPAVMDFKACDDWGKVSWLNNSFMADLIEVYLERKHAALLEMGSLIPAGRKHSMLVTEVRQLFSDFHVLLSEGTELLRLCRFDAAAFYFEKASFLVPDSSELRVLRAKCDFAVSRARSK
jgi:hypothetical protein